jgi:hypothetical protein
MVQHLTVYNKVKHLTVYNKVKQLNMKNMQSIMRGAGVQVLFIVKS